MHILPRRGPLLHKTIVLVTNALQYLPLADNILWMENGAIRAQGKYAELVEAGESCVSSTGASAKQPKPTCRNVLHARSHPSGTLDQDIKP